MSRTARILTAVAAFVVVVCAATYLFRDALATRAAGFAIDHSDQLHCTRPDIDIAAGLDRILIGEVECTMDSGPVRYVHTEGLTTVRLSGLKDLSVHVDKATIDQRDRDVSNVETNTLGDVAEIAGVTDMLYKGMLDAAELYSPTLPPVEVDELVMKRAGKLDSVLHGFRQSLDGEWNRSQAARVQPPGGGDQPVSVRSLDMRVTPDKGKMTANIFLSDPSPGEKPDMTVNVEGHRLDASHPKISLEI